MPKLTEGAIVYGRTGLRNNGQTDSNNRKAFKNHHILLLASLSILYITVSRIISPSLKSIEQF